MAHLLPLPIYQLILILAVVSLFVSKYLTYRRLSHIKGPPLAAWTEFWAIKQAVQARSNVVQLNLLKKYGSPVRIGPNQVLTGDPDLLRHMSAPRSGWTRSNWYASMKLDPQMDSVFSSQDEAFHSQVKALEIGAYNGRDVDTHEEDVDENVVKLLDLIKNEYADKPLDLVDMASWFTLDVISKIAFGESFGFMKANRDLWDYNKIQRQVLPVLEVIMTAPFLRQITQLPFVLKRSAPKPTEKDGQGAVYGWAQKRIQARYAAAAEKQPSRNDMLNHFISKNVPRIQTEAESRLQVLAGADSTSSIVRNTMMLVISHPSTYIRLRQEIDQAVQQGKVSFPVAKYSEASELQYLQAVIWEGIRMYPPLFGLKSKTAPPGGDTFKGVFYPEGTEVGLCDDGICRREDVFGADFDLFRPERFLDKDPEVNNNRIRTTELIFGHGRYGCLGKWIALMELSKTFIALFQNFDWSIPDPFRGSKMIANGIWIQEGLNVMAVPRQT